VRFTTKGAKNTKGRRLILFCPTHRRNCQLDRILGRKKNLAALEKALEVEFVKDPVRFFRSIIMPLLARSQS